MLVKRNTARSLAPLTNRSPRRIALMTVIALALPLTALATKRVLRPAQGPISVSAGQTLVFQTAASNAAATSMDVTVSIDNGSGVDIVDTKCQIYNGTMSCLGLGSSQMTAIDAANNAYAFDPADLGVMDWECGPVPEAVKVNIWGVCGLETNDFSDCRDTCTALHPGTSGAALTGIGSGCMLICTCFDDEGDVLGTFQGVDT